MTEENFWFLVEKFIDGELTTQEHTDLLEQLNDQSFRENLLLAGQLADQLPEIEYRLMKDRIKGWKPD